MANNFILSNVETHAQILSPVPVVKSGFTQGADKNAGHTFHLSDEKKKIENLLFYHFTFLFCKTLYSRRRLKWEKHYNIFFLNQHGGYFYLFYISFVCPDTWLSQPLQNFRTWNSPLTQLVCPWISPQKAVTQPLKQSIIDQHHTEMPNLSDHILVVAIFKKGGLQRSFQLSGYHTAQHTFEGLCGVAEEKTLAAYSTLVFLDTHCRWCSSSGAPNQLFEFKLVLEGLKDF